jgi:hypothetical protein
MDVFEKISAQQGKERTAVWMVGEQLKDMIRDDPMAQEIVERDLDVKEMELAACEKKIKAFADGHRTGSFACVTPAEAERIIREFYGLPDAGAPAPKTADSGKVIDLASFF